MDRAKIHTIPHGKKDSRRRQKSFIVRHYDSKKKKTLQVGPFHDEEEAREAVKHFLKRGTCSWLVTYHG